MSAPSKKCEMCDGQGRRVIRITSIYYKCGFVDEARICHACKGSGKQPEPVVDMKLAAAGGDR